jgi:hypothetical protein
MMKKSKRELPGDAGSIRRNKPDALRSTNCSGQCSIRSRTRDCNTSAACAAETAHCQCTCHENIENDISPTHVSHSHRSAPHNFLLTIRRKFTQIIRHDTSSRCSAISSPECVRTLPHSRSKSSDRALSSTVLQFHTRGRYHANHMSLLCLVLRHPLPLHQVKTPHGGRVHSGITYCHHGHRQHKIT